MRLVFACLLALGVVACIDTRPNSPANVVIEGTGHDAGKTVAVSPDSMLVASGGKEGRIRLWRVADGSPVAWWRAHDGSVNGLAFMPNGEGLVTAGFDGELALWGIDGEPLARQAAESPVTSADLSDDGLLFVTGHADGAVRWWRATTLAAVAEMPDVHGGDVLAVAVRPGNGMVATAGKDGRVGLLKRDGGQRWLDAPPSDAHTLTFAPDARTLYGAGWFNLYRWDAIDAEVVTIPTPHRGIIRHIAFTPDGQHLASISRETDSAVILLDPQTGGAAETMGKHEMCGDYVAMSPNGRYVVTTSDDATVRIWDRENLKPPINPKGYW